MIIEKKCVTLVDDTYSYIYRHDGEEILQTFKNEITDYVNNINNLISPDLKEISNEEFYNLISKVYSISLEEEDYLEIISKRNNKEYDRFIEIETLMTFTGIATEGRGKNFSWWENLNQIRYIVAVSSDFDMKPYGPIFSKTDLKKMINNKNIVIISEKQVPIDDEPDFKQEEYEMLPILDLNLSENSVDLVGEVCESNECFPIIIEILRKKITKKTILKDMKEYISELQNDIDIILSSSHDYAYSEISELCNSWFDNSEEKQIYNRLVKMLINN